MTLQNFLRVPTIKIRDKAKAGIEPLRILFCGSDGFSIASLRKLHERYQTNKDLIASIDVVCRPGKAVGRGLKTIRNVPISGTARELCLPLYEIDTFTNWEPPKPQGMPINLIVAVSFGLLVPPRILGAAKYGGLNVHPSMLPDFHGPAPLHHTLLSDSQWTGITVQMLHSKYFDQGIKLLQHPYPGIKHDCRSVEELSQKLAPGGGEMLDYCIENHLYLYNSLIEAPKTITNETGVRGRYAPKLTKADRFIDWETWTGEEIMRRHQVLGPLWSLAKAKNDSQTERRIIWSTGFEITSRLPDIDLPIGQPIVTGYPSANREVWVRTHDRQVLKIGQIKIEGGQQTEPLKAAIGAGMNDSRLLHADGALFQAPILLTLPERFRDLKRPFRKTNNMSPTNLA